MRAGGDHMADRLTPEQAMYVLDHALGEKKLNQNDVTRYLAASRREIAELEARLAQLRRLGGARPQNAPVAVEPEKAAKPQGKKQAAPSAKTLASRKVQGMYLAHIAQIPKKDRPKFKELAKKEGRDAAIAAMRKALGK